MKTPGELVSAPDYALAFRLLEPVPEKPCRLLLLLHGVGGHEGQMAATGALGDDQTLVVLPRAPRSVGGDMFGWFRVDLSVDPPEIEAEEAEESRLKLVQLIGQLQDRHDIAPGHTVLGGFSQGGILAASAALTTPRSVAGFALLCGRILPEIAPRIGPRQALARLQALVIHGRRDETLPVSWAHRADDWLDKLGVPHTLHLHDAGHELTDAMQAQLRAWLCDGEQGWNR